MQSENPHPEKPSVASALAQSATDGQSSPDPPQNTPCDATDGQSNPAAPQNTPCDATKDRKVKVLRYHRSDLLI